MSYEWLYREPPPAFYPSIGKYAAAGYSWDGIEKLLEFNAYDEGGNPNIIAVDHTIKGYGLNKFAAAFPAEMLSKIAEIEHDPNKLHVVGNALGATETFGSNRNQDSFPRMGLMNSDPHTYGHKTFEDAHVFKHHVNKDPNKGIGKVTYAYYDSMLDKVLLLYYILKDKAPHIIDRLEKGESLETSMGCRCPYDVCSICGKKAKDRTEYCEHLKNHPNAVMPNGQKVMAHTPHPRFFDQSHVAKGADPIAKTLQVVDGPAKEAYARRPRIFDMSPGTPVFEKSAAPTFASDGLPLGDPMEPRRSPEEVRRIMDEGISRIHPEDLKRFRQQFHKAACGAPDGEGCSCKEKTAGLLDAETLEDFLHKAARNVTASITKEIPGMAEALDPPTTDKPGAATSDVAADIKTASFAQELLWVLELTEPDLSPAFLDKLADYNSNFRGQHRPAKVLSTLAGEGIVLKDHEFQYLLGKFGEACADRTDVSVNGHNWARSIRERITDDVLEARSCLPEHLYKRATAMAKLAHGQHVDPQQMMQLMQVMQMMNSKGGPSGHLQAGGQGPYIPASVRQHVMDEALLNMYRSNLGRIDPSAFDRVPGIGISGMPKGGSLMDFVEACRGLPTTAYLKYAYQSRPDFDAPADWLHIEVPENHVWSQEFVMKPRANLEKVASVLAGTPADLLDAATAINLRFVRDALFGERR